MSEEEKKAIESAKEYVENEEILSVSPFDIKILLDLVEKQQEEIEDYKSGYFFTAKQMHYIDEDYIAKDKIIGKIEELEKEKEKYKGDKGLIYSQVGFIQSGINVLKELLEEQ